RAAEQVVADVRIGLGYTAVELAGGQVGVAFTFRQSVRDCCCAFQGMHPLSGRPASELITLLTSADPIEAAVGLACVNALVNAVDQPFPEGDILDCLELRPDDNVGMVGHFKPLVPRLKENVRSLTVFDQNTEAHDGIRPADQAFDALSYCQVALITAAAVINHTIDDLLASAVSCREVAIIGASTPMLPDAFSAANVTLLSGVVVQKPKEVLRVVSEGGGMQQFKPHIRKVSLRSPR
ncbi:MAG: DUF364 domain-containing protein, partial [Planctomycetes bacterium]|nr:DUF364 domain-containing protein [Planctomycetota bacterium]